MRMRHRKAKKRLGRSTSERQALIRNLVLSLFKHEKIKTTEPKAKQVRQVAEKLITIAKNNSLHSRRQVRRIVPDEAVIKKLFDTIAPRYAERPGGYTYIAKIGPRRGDAAPLVQLALVEE